MLISFKLLKIVPLLFLLMIFASCDNVSKSDYEALKIENQNFKKKIDELQNQISTLKKDKIQNDECPKNLKISIKLPATIPSYKYNVKFNIDNFNDSLYYHVLQRNSNEGKAIWHLQESGKVIKEGFSNIQFGEEQNGKGQSFDVMVIVSRKLVEKIKGDHEVNRNIFELDECKPAGEKRTTRSN